MLESMLGAILQILFIIILIGLVWYLVSREFNCWYFKINARLKEQETTNQLLLELLTIARQNAIETGAADSPHYFDTLKRPLTNAGERQSEKAASADPIETLERLKSKGLITDAEYQQKKGELTE